MLTKLLNSIERAGNRLPDPITLFFILIGIVISLSVFFSALGVAVKHPITGSDITVVNLLSKESIQKILTEMPQTFADFPPLGLVLLVMLGAGVAEKSGFMGAALTSLARSVPYSTLTPTLLFLGVMSSLAVDAGYVILVPLGAALFLAAGKHPIVGLAVAFAGVAGAVTANLLPTPLDALLAGITQEAAQIIDPRHEVSITSNYYFMVALTPLLVIAGTLVTHYIIEPRFEKDENLKHHSGNNEPQRLTDYEKNALSLTLKTATALLAIILLLVIPHGGYLRSDEGDIKPFLNSLAAILSLFLLVLGVIYGVKCNKIKNDRDVIAMASASMSEMGNYIVLAFAAAHFIAFFSWSNLAFVFSIKSASFLSELEISRLPLLLAVVMLTGLINLFIGSASAKWATLSAILVPTMMLLGITPEATQNAYRIGDSITNIISPLFPYAPLIIVFGRRYISSFGVGTLIALMLPYSLAFTLVGVVLMIIWYIFNIPLGPGALIFM